MPTEKCAIIGIHYILKYPKILKLWMVLYLMFYVYIYVLTSFPENTLSFSRSW